MMPIDTFLHQLLHLPSVLFAQLSPDARWVAFVWQCRHENLDVFLVPSDGSAPPVALTHTPEYTWLTSWTPDSRAVIVEEDHDGDERNRLFRVDLEHPLEMVPLTEDRPPYFIRGGNLHPDTNTLFYGANYDFTAGQTLEPTWIYRHDLASGKRLPIARPKHPVDMEVSLNRKGTHLIYSRKDRHPGGRQFHLVDVNGNEDREILNYGDEVKTFARWFPDSEQILVLSESTDWCPQAYQSLGVYSIETQKVRWLIDDPKRTLEGARVSPDGTIIVDEIVQANHTPTFINQQTWEEKPFPRLPGNLIPLGRAVDGAWIAMYYSATNPVELVRFDERASTPDDITSLTRTWELSDLQPSQLTPVEAFCWSSIDGLEIQGWLYRAQPNPRRAIVYIHGGPTHHSEDKLNAQLQYFVSRGFNVLDVNYRGSTGFGLKFRDAIKEDGWGGREQADIATGIEALIKQDLADPGRVGVTGTSYGGYSSWYLLTHYPPELIAASAPICGMTDLVVDYETTRPDLRRYSEEMIGGRPDQVPEKYFERSPIHFVQDIRGKLLIVQGARDPNVTPENVRLVRERLEAHRIPYELLVFEDEGHGIVKTSNLEKLYPRLADFFDKALTTTHRLSSQTPLLPPL